MYLDIESGQMCGISEIKNGVKLKDGIYIKFNTNGFDNHSAVFKSYTIDITDIIMSEGSSIDIHIIKDETDIVLARIRKESGVWQSYGTMKEFTDIVGRMVTSTECAEAYKLVNTVLNSNKINVDKSKLSIFVSYVEYKTAEPVYIEDNKICDEFGIADMAFNDVPMCVSSMQEKTFNVGSMKFKDIVNHIKELAEEKVIDSIIVSQDDTYLMYADDMLNSPKIKVSTFGDIIDTFIKIYEMNKEG